MTPDALARFMGAVDQRCDDIVVDAIRGGWFESRDAHRADALVDLARPDSVLGYTYRGGPGNWEWIPPDNRDQDLSPLRKIINTARRC